MKTKNVIVCAMFIVCISFSLSGCASLNDTIAGTPWKAYSGQQLPSDQVVIIKTSGIRDYFSEAYVFRIDKEPVPAGEIGGYIETLPGSHTLEVSITQRLGAPGSILGAATEKRAQGTITLEAEAGHIYIVDGRVVDGQAAIWIEDEKTRQVIAGLKP